MPTPLSPMTSRLDTPRHDFYNARPLGWALMLALVVGAGPLTARAEVTEGVQLPDGSKKVGEHRYRSSLAYKDTLKYYLSIYPPASHARRTIANQPGISAVHISNPGGKGFEGLNIYEANDETRIYIVPEAEVKAPKKKAGSSRRK